MLPTWKQLSKAWTRPPSTSSPDVSKLTPICGGTRKSSSNTPCLTMNSNSYIARAKNSGSRKRTVNFRISKISGQILQRVSETRRSSRNAPASPMSSLMSASYCCSWSNEKASTRATPSRTLTTQSRSRSRKRTATLKRTTKAIWRGRPWTTRCPRRSTGTRIIGGGTSGSPGVGHQALRANLPPLLNLLNSQG